MTTLQRLLRLAISLIGVFSLLGYFGKFSRILELTNHFRVQYLLGAIVGLILLLAIKQWRWSLVAALCVALNAYFVLPWFSLFSSPVKVAGTRLKLLQSNVQHDNHQYEKLIAFVREEAPDIVAFEEVDEPWAEKLRTLQDSYPYFKIEPQELGGGIALFSKIKPETIEKNELGLSWRAGIEASFKLENTLVHLLVIHPPTPTEAINFPPRNQQLQAATERLQSWPAPKILMGDLNDTMWSSYHSPMLEKANMVNTRRGQGIVPSWPSWLMLPPLMIPIDHCLVSPEIIVDSVKAGKNIGSDHLPILIELIVPHQK